MSARKTRPKPEGGESRDQDGYAGGIGVIGPWFGWFPALGWESLPPRAGRSRWLEGA